MLSKVLEYGVVILVGLMVFLGVDYFIYGMPGFDLLSSVHSLLSPEFLSLTQVLNSVLILLILVSIIKYLGVISHAEVIRGGVILGLLIVLTGLINIGQQIDRLPIDFLANQLLPLCSVLLFKITLTTWLMSLPMRVYFRNDRP